MTTAFRCWGWGTSYRSLRSQGSQWANLVAKNCSIKQWAVCRYYITVRNSSLQCSSDSIGSRAKCYWEGNLIERLKIYWLWLVCPPIQATSALLPTAAGPLLTGSSDACIRCWDAAQIDHSYMVCGPPSPLDRPRREAKIARLRSAFLINSQMFLSGRLYLDTTESSIWYPWICSVIGSAVCTKVHEREEIRTTNKMKRQRCCNHLSAKGLNTLSFRNCALGTTATYMA